MKPNILFIVIDSLRADKCHGEKKTSVTPNIDSLIENGTYFSQTITHGQSTIPCMSSILTGLYPFESMSQNEDIFVINPKAETYIENLEEFGYESHALVQESLSHMGLDKIFKKNFEMYPVTLKTWTGLDKNIIQRIETFSKDEPWFYYIHLYDLYIPFNQQDIKEVNNLDGLYSGDTTYDRMFSAIDESIGKILENVDQEKTLIVITADHGHEKGAFTESMENIHQENRKVRKHEPGVGFKIGQKIAHKFPKSMLPVRKKLAEKYKSRTDEEIKERIKPEIEKIENSELRPYEKRLMKNAIAPTAHIYDDRVHVPLILSGYNVPTKKMITQQVQSVDIFPTIAGIIGMNTSNYGKRGRDLMPIIKNDNFDEVPAYIETATNSIKTQSNNTIGIRTSEYKYFRDRNEKTKNVHLYDLKNDPLEEYNISEKNHELVKKMEITIEKILQSKSLEHDESKDLSKEEMKKARAVLSKLGYI